MSVLHVLLCMPSTRLIKKVDGVYLIEDDMELLTEGFPLKIDSIKERERRLICDCLSYFVILCIERERVKAINYFLLVH